MLQALPKDHAAGFTPIRLLACPIGFETQAVRLDVQIRIATGSRPQKSKLPNPFFGLRPVSQASQDDFHLSDGLTV